MEALKNNYDLLREILQQGERVQFSKGSLVVLQDNVIENMYYIKKGIVRGLYIDENGKEVTKCFSAEGDIFSVEGFLYHRPASYYIECIEDADCIKMSYNQIQEWLAKNPENMVFVNELIIGALSIMEDRAKVLLLSDAKERYERFCVEYEKIVGRIKQKYIASYLGINEASLCRIKRSMM